MITFKEAQRANSKYARWGHRASKGKYQNHRIELDGLKFDSKKEAQRYKVLKLMEKDGLIEQLKCQVAFVLAEGVRFANEERKKPALRYFADFVYTQNGSYIVEDVKSKTTRSLPEYRIKKHLMMSVHGIEITEV